MVDNTENAATDTTTADTTTADTTQPAPDPEVEAQPARKPGKGKVMVRGLVDGGGMGVAIGDGRWLRKDEFAEVTHEQAKVLIGNGQAEAE